MVNMYRYIKYSLLILTLIGCTGKSASISEEVPIKKKSEVELIKEMLRAYNSSVFKDDMPTASSYLSAGHRKKFDKYLKIAKQINEVNLYNEAIPDLSVVLGLLRKFSNEEFDSVSNEDLYHRYNLYRMRPYEDVQNIEVISPENAFGQLEVYKQETIGIAFEKDEDVWKINSWPLERLKWDREKAILKEFNMSKKDFVDGMFEMIN